MLIAQDRVHDANERRADSEVGRPFGADDFSPGDTRLMSNHSKSVFVTGQSHLVAKLLERSPGDACRRQHRKLTVAVLSHDVSMHVARGHTIFLCESPPKAS